MQQDEPDIDCHAAALVDQFAQYVAVAKRPVGHRLDGSVARRIGFEIDRPVVREIDLSCLAVRTHELAGMVAAGNRHRIQAKVAKLSHGGLNAGFRQIPRIGVNGLVAHRSPREC